MAARRDKNGSGTGKVIHVVFGPHGGRAPDPPPPKKRDRSPSLHDQEPVSDVFTAKEVEKLTGLTVARLRSLAKHGVVAPSAEVRGQRVYTFADLIMVRTAQGLLQRQVPMRELTSAVAALRTSIPRVTRPLSELRVVTDGKRLAVRADKGTFEAKTGQMLLDFDLGELREDVVRVLRPKTRADRQRVAFELYLRAAELDERPETVAEAEALYRRAVDLDPDLAIAYTNLGNIHFRRGEEDPAVALYQKALTIDENQPEARYNLGYVLLDRGSPKEAVVHFESAIRADGSFADAHFYLAMAYEAVGERGKARPSWKRYLELEPRGPWADVARRHL